jgi:2-C-methyl-D-erythritol 4-phosphate cytidylyltransferase
MVSAIIVAAGSSRRMGFDKLFAPLAGKPVLLHSVRAFADCKEIDEIVLVTKPEQVAAMDALVREEGIPKVSKVIAGGAERHFSVWNGLQAVRSDGSEFVAIHDGARPLTTPQLIRACLEMAREHGAACVASQVPDTVKRASAERMVTESVERTGLWAMQTPQIFASGLILQAYAALISRHEMVTDEVSAVQKIGKKIALLKNDDWNFKITFPQDLELAEHVLGLRAKKRRGAKAAKAGSRKPKA